MNNIEKIVEINCDPKNIESGISNIVRRNKIFLSTIHLIVQTVATRAVKM